MRGFNQIDFDSLKDYGIFIFPEYGLTFDEYKALIDKPRLH